MVCIGLDHPCRNKVLEAWEGSTLDPQPIPDLYSNLKLFLQVSGQNPLTMQDLTTMTSNRDGAYGSGT